MNTFALHCKRHMTSLGVCPKGLSDHEKQYYLVWWNQVELFCLNTKHHICRKPGTIPTVKHGGDRIMIRGYFSAAGTGRQVRIEGKMNWAKCREIFDEILLKSAQDLRRGWRFTFQQDNDPKHTAKTMQESLNVLEPGPEPHRNLKIALQRRSPSNLIELARICREEWEKLPQYRCAKRHTQDWRL